jgi:hypothetical protein
MSISLDPSCWYTFACLAKRIKKTTNWEEYLKNHATSEEEKVFISTQTKFSE